MSSAPDLLDAERENYLRLMQLLVEGGTPALRKQFEDGLVTLYPGATLGGVLAAKKGQLQQLKTKGILNHTQWGMLYPASGDPDMNSFDITLLSVLLRNIGSSRRPTDPFWNNDPPDTDTSEEANYVRLRLLRNEIGHSPYIKIIKGEFETYWRRISNVLISLGGNRGEIDHLKTKPLATKDYVGVLQQWMASDFVIFEELQEIRKENKQRDEETKEILMKIACQLKIHIDCKTQSPSPPSSLSSQASNDEAMQTIVDYFFQKLNRDCQRLVLTELTARYNAEYVTSEETNSLSITISCQSLEGLQKLWDDAQTGRLNEEMEKLLVVDEVLQLYNLKEIKLQTKIDPEDFVNCWNQMKSDPDTPSADEHDQEVEQELMRRMREAEDAAQREKEKRKVIEAAPAQMIQENTSKLIMSSAPDLLDAERENYLRLLQLLVEGGTPALRKQFEDGLVTLYPGATLGGVLAAKKGQLQQLKTKGILNHTQWGMLYPASGDPNMNNFDITLLSVLLRNIGSSRRPTDPFWNNDPPDTDTSKEANYVRLRLLRNEIGHSPNITIKEGEFETYWRRISNVLISLGGNKGEIDHLKTKPLATRDYVGVVQRWRALDDRDEEAKQRDEEAKQRDEEAKQRDEEAKQRDEEAKQRDKEAKQRDEEIRKEFNKFACQVNIHIDLKTVRPSPPSSTSSQALYEKNMHSIVENFIRGLNLLPTYYRKNAVDLFTTRYNAEYVTSEETVQSERDQTPDKDRS